jgi:hypothetical protein
LKQFWTKFIIVLSSFLSAQAVLGAPLSSQFVVDHYKSSLPEKTSVHKKLALNTSIVKTENNSQCSNTLFNLFKYKTVPLFANHQQRLIKYFNDCCTVLANATVTAMCRNAFMQQRSVHNVIKAQQNACFQSQASYQAARQKIALQLS